MKFEANERYVQAMEGHQKAKWGESLRPFKSVSQLCRGSGDYQRIFVTHKQSGDSRRMLGDYKGALKAIYGCQRLYTVSGSY